MRGMSLVGDDFKLRAAEEMKKEIEERLNKLSETSIFEINDNDKILREAFERVKKYNFSKGLPVCYKDTNGEILYEFPDGTIKKKDTYPMKENKGPYTLKDKEKIKELIQRKREEEEQDTKKLENETKELLNNLKNTTDRAGRNIKLIVTDNLPPGVTDVEYKILVEHIESTITKQPRCKKVEMNPHIYEVTDEKVESEIEHYNAIYSGKLEKESTNKAIFHIEELEKLVKNNVNVHLRVGERALRIARDLLQLSLRNPRTKLTEEETKLVEKRYDE